MIDLEQLGMFIMLMLTIFATIVMTTLTVYTTLWALNVNNLSRKARLGSFIACPLVIGVLIICALQS